MNYLVEIRLFFHHLWFLCQKEIVSTLKDPRMQVIIFLSAFLQGILYGYGATYDLDHVPYAVLDQSHSRYSQSLISKIDGAAAFERVRTLSNSNEIGDLVTSEEVLVAVVIPQDFADKINRHETAPVQVIVDGRNTQVAGLINVYINRIVADWNTEIRGREAPIQIQTRTWYNPNQLSRWNFLPAIIAMISFVMVMVLSGMSIAKEREEGTFDQLLVTPFSPTEILIGKAVPPMLIGLFQSTILLCISLFWFEVPIAGSVISLYITLAIFILSATGIGLSISAISNNMQQALVYVFVTLMPLALLSGMATPINNMPEFFQIVTYANPMRFATDSLRRIYLEGATLTDVSGNFIPMLCVAAITIPLAGWLFRNKLD